MEDLELRRINVITARLTEVTKNKQREERQIKSEKCRQRRQFSPNFRIQTAGDLRPPIMQPAHEPSDHSADHDVMEVGDDEISVVHVNIHRERGEKKSGETADHKQSDESQRVKHWRGEMDRAFVQSRCPVKNFHARRDSNQKT